MATYHTDGASLEREDGTRTDPVDTREDDADFARLTERQPVRDGLERLGGSAENCSRRSSGRRASRTTRRSPRSWKSAWARSGRRGRGASGARAADAHLGDLNLDGSVGARDLGVLLNARGPFNGAVRADLNASGAVDALDLATLLAGW